MSKKVPEVPSPNPPYATPPSTQRAPGLGQRPSARNNGLSGHGGNIRGVTAAEAAHHPVHKHFGSTSHQSHILFRASAAPHRRRPSTMGVYRSKRLSLLPPQCSPQALGTFRQPSLLTECIPGFRGTQADRLTHTTLSCPVAGRDFPHSCHQLPSAHSCWLGSADPKHSRWRLLNQDR